MLRRTVPGDKGKRSTAVILVQYLAHKSVIEADAPWNPPWEAWEKTEPHRNTSPPKLKLG